MADFDIEFCPYCGEEINYMANTCYQCGEDLPEGASFCPHCGEEVDESGLICEECGEVISEEDVEKYNQLSLEEKTALREAYLQKKSARSFPAASVPSIPFFRMNPVFTMQTSQQMDTTLPMFQQKHGESGISGSGKR